MMRSWLDIAADVRSLQSPNRGLDAEIHFHLKEGVGVGYSADSPKYTASLDAAMSVVPADYDWIVASVNGQVGGTPYACVGSTKEHFAETPVLSLLLAAILARAE